jgi:hypothetical protein
MSGSPKNRGIGALQNGLPEKLGETRNLPLGKSGRIHNTLPSRSNSASSRVGLFSEPRAGFRVFGLLAERLVFFLITVDSCR